ncbi:MAG: hypothetical protein IJR44_05380, partial [Neisseriaceae bacterium]|nr:hypothetical protein [Neisseriaceae bacterium]
ALLEGGHLYKIRLPLPKPATDKDVPQNLWEVAERMREKIALSQKQENEEQSPFVQGKSYVV